MGTGLLVLDEPTAQLDPAGTRGGRRAPRSGELAAAGRPSSSPSTTWSSERTDRCLVLDGGRAVGLDVPGVALGPEVGGRAGVAVPATAALAAALGLPARSGLDAAAVATAIRSAGPTERAAAVRALAAGAAEGAAGGPVVAPWEPVRDVPLRRSRSTGLRPPLPGRRRGRPRRRSLAVAAGETVAIVGQNGSGKTTLVKHLVGLLRPGEGTVRVGGARPGRADDRRGSPARSGSSSRTPTTSSSSGPSSARSRSGRATFGWADADVARLVGGRSRRSGSPIGRPTNPYDLDLSDRKLVALASVLAMDPAVLVLDEPTTGQDGPGIARVGAIVDAWAAAGRTVVAITHDMEFAARHFGRIVVLRGGLVVADGAPSEVLAASNAPLLASTGLEPPPLAVLAGLVGLGGVPLRTEDLLVAAG